MFEAGPEAEHSGLTHVSEEPVSMDTDIGWGGVPMKTERLETTPLNRDQTHNQLDISSRAEYWSRGQKLVVWM